MPRRVGITGLKGRRSVSRLMKVKGTAPTSFMRGKVPKFAIEIKGEAHLIKVFKQLSKNTESATYKAINAAVKIVSKEAYKIVTVGPYRAVNTGKLSKSIRGILEDYIIGKYVYGTAGVFNLHYAIYVHEGHHSVEAKPFLVLALRRKEGVIIKLIEQAIQKDIKIGWA